jgi:hypothetical protein
MEGRDLDGIISRVLEGKTVRGVSKDGVYMTIHCTNGERWAIGWADFTAGKGFAGEPSIVSIDEMRQASGPIDVVDGSIHRALEHRTIESARTDGDVLYIQCADGRRYGLTWVDPQTRERIRGEPCLTKVDVRVTLGSVNAFDDGTDLEVGSHAFCGGLIMRRGNVSRCLSCGWTSAL